MEQMERSEILLQEKEKDLNHMKFVFKDLEKKVDFSRKILKVSGSWIRLMEQAVFCRVCHPGVSQLLML